MLAFGSNEADSCIFSLLLEFLIWCRFVEVVSDRIISSPKWSVVTLYRTNGTRSSYLCFADLHHIICCWFLEFLWFFWNPGSSTNDGEEKNIRVHIPRVSFHTVWVVWIFMKRTSVNCVAVSTIWTTGLLFIHIVSTCTSWLDRIFSGPIVSLNLLGTAHFCLQI